VSTLRASVSAGESGPVITLSGQADITTAAELSELITGQLAEETQQLTVDVAGLDFADTAAIRVLLVAARRPGAAASATSAGQSAGNPRCRRGSHYPRENRGSA
jgi:anti-anti-sigma factor